MEARPRSQPRLGRWTKAFLGLLGGLVVAIALVWMLVPEPDATLVDIASVDDLRKRFNEDRGAPRIILLVSPT